MVKLVKVLDVKNYVKKLEDGLNSIRKDLIEVKKWKEDEVGRIDEFLLCLILIKKVSDIYDESNDVLDEEESYIEMVKEINLIIKEIDFNDYLKRFDLDYVEIDKC